MGVLEGLCPEKVFSYFEKICNIPHGSGEIWQISNYLADFAKKRGLEYYQDRIGNVIIIKEAAAGYENSAPVMLQGHMDMVAVKKPDCDIDMEKDGLRLRINGDKIYAEGTSLGGDDGIAVAYALALLDDKNAKHPRLEVVITVDEEVGMNGAREIDLSACKAKTMINIDSEEEGIFLAGCAGGARVNHSLYYEKNAREGLRCRVCVSGLVGGHSGVEIHKERGNANKLLGRVLYRLYEKYPFELVSLEGGFADNAIPREACGELLFTDISVSEVPLKAGEKLRAPGQMHHQEMLQKWKQAVTDMIQEQYRELQAEYAHKDRDICVYIAFDDFSQQKAADRQMTQKILSYLVSLPNGVQSMSGAMEGLVETSLNLGILDCKEGRLQAGISVRSSYEGAKRSLIDRLKGLGALAGAETEVTGDYPGWAYSLHSPLRERMIRLFQEMYGKEPEIQAIHAGLECGLFAGKIAGLDCVSMGPDIINIHTTEEELSISSTKRVWEFLTRLLEEMK